MRPPMPLRQTRTMRTLAPPLQTRTLAPPRQTRTPRYLEFLLKYPCNQYSRRIPVHVARDFFQFFTEVS